MIEEDLHTHEKSKRKVFGDVTNTLRKRNHPLLPGKFLIGNDMIRKQDMNTVTIASEDPTTRKKRIIGELVNINKGKQKVNWSSGDSKLLSFSRNPLLDVDLEASKRGFLVNSWGKDKDEHEHTFSSESLISHGELPNFPVKGSDTMEFWKLAEKSIPRQPMNEDHVHEDKLNILNPSQDVPGKNCSCSFCLKARYIWADLLYEDRKGRLLEVNKSRKGAKNLAGSSCCHDIGERVASSNEKYVKLEQDLRQLWKALFVHVESLLTCESAQLQSSLLKLKELRESCMRDIESTSDHQK